MAVAIPRSQLLELRKTVDITFLPGAPSDGYRLRNIRVVLRLTSGAEQSSAIAAHEYSTRPSGEGEAKPIRLAVDLPIK